MEIAEYAKEDIASGTDPLKALFTLINQCLKRDADWKEYYVECMGKINGTFEEPKMLNIFAAELEAESSYQTGDPDKAVARLQKLLDKEIKTDKADRGWYLQEMARYKYAQSKSQSNDLQLSAHRLNRFLLSPKFGMQVQKIELIGQKRIERIHSWASNFSSFEELRLTLDEILNDFQFGVRAQNFERAVDRLAFALGFEGQRPDKEWKEGPDNLWAIRDGEYLVIECKNEVELKRSEINKDETGQMNNAIAWFKRNYSGAKSTNLMIIPPKAIGHAGGFSEPVRIMRNANLKQLSANVDAFYREFAKYDFASLSEAKTEEWLNIHHLSVDEILSKYSEEPKQL